jgi:class 3 adenylate cyclase
MTRTCPMEKNPVKLAVLFADITGSTRLYEKLGNARALECVGLCLNIMRESALGCGGRVVQTIGDEVLCVFPTALAATQAATEMQSRVEMQDPVSGQRLQIHIGLQFGPVLEEGQDVFGDCVNVAARMVKLAKPSQIIAGGECVEALSKPMKDQTRVLDKLAVKGREQEVDVYEVLWRQSEELTHMASRAPGPPKQAQVRLSLRHGGKEMILGPGRELIKLGRDSTSDVVIADRKASREHARIERRRDKFVLVDVSSNGTFVTFHGEPEMAVKREEVLLRGRGTISFGHPYSADPTEVAAFEVGALT